MFVNSHVWVRVTQLASACIQAILLNFKLLKRISWFSINHIYISYMHLKFQYLENPCLNCLYIFMRFWHWITRFDYTYAMLTVLPHLYIANLDILCAYYVSQSVWGHCSYIHIRTIHSPFEYAIGCICATFGYDLKSYIGWSYFICREILSYMLKWQGYIHLNLHTPV